ncbi:hypothetical protein F2P81_021704 [Scophthalmus maximus]|uniref:Uncharacterized protein n=1 Tax=Scophthalmus maximus TaxID=52904 RepID=A0A6A4S1U9_SCOMX|nr:hypothetical protein F2P81_021704 [Scophthalmus maximus]
MTQTTCAGRSPVSRGASRFQAHSSTCLKERKRNETPDFKPRIVANRVTTVTVPLQSIRRLNRQRSYGGSFPLASRVSQPASSLPDVISYF